MNEEPINIKADDEHFEAQKAHLDKYQEGSTTWKDSLYFPIGSRVALRRWWTMDTQNN